MFDLAKSALVSATALVFLTACGGAPEDPNAGAEMLDNGMTVRAQIEARQEGFKAIGSEFKTINDQLRSGSPDMAPIQAAASALPAAAEGIETWFPVGTGPETGVATEALATIWEEPEDFESKVNDFVLAISALETAAQTGDADVIQAAARATGATCGACHDKFRLDD